MMPVSPADFMNPDPAAECELVYSGQYDEAREDWAAINPASDDFGPFGEFEGPLPAPFDDLNFEWWDELREYGGES